MMDKNKLESPALPNNFSGKKPADCSAPKIGNGPGYPVSPNSNNRGKDGTSK
jgi:hypothetical protein